MALKPTEEIVKGIKESEEALKIAEEYLKVLRDAGIPDEELEKRVREYKTRLRALKRAFEIK
ncbi:MAG: hypothetical protein ACXQTR_03385 [Candidatus Methanospirareceae archaeon]